MTLCPQRAAVGLFLFLVADAIVLADGTSKLYCRLTFRLVLDVFGEACTSPDFQTLDNRKFMALPVGPSALWPDRMIPADDESDWRSCSRESALSSVP